MTAADTRLLGTAAQIARLAEPSDQKNEFLGDTRRVSVVSANVNAGQSKAGVEQGPDAIIAQDHFSERILDAGWEVKKTGNLEYDVVADDQATPYGMLRPRTCGAANKALHERMLSFNEADFGLVLGGDHSIAIGSISAMLKVTPPPPPHHPPSRSLSLCRRCMAWIPRNLSPPLFLSLSLLCLCEISLGHRGKSPSPVSLRLRQSSVCCVSVAVAFVWLLSMSLISRTPLPPGLSSSSVSSLSRLPRVCD